MGGKVIKSVRLAHQDERKGTERGRDEGESEEKCAKIIIIVEGIKNSNK